VNLSKAVKQLSGENRQEVVIASIDFTKAITKKYLTMLRLRTTAIIKYVVMFVSTGLETISIGLQFRLSKLGTLLGGILQMVAHRTLLVHMVHTPVLFRLGQLVRLSTAMEIAVMEFVSLCRPRQTASLQSNYQRMLCWLSQILGNLLLMKYSEAAQWFNTNETGRFIPFTSALVQFQTNSMLTKYLQILGETRQAMS